MRTCFTIAILGLAACGGESATTAPVDHSLMHSGVDAAKGGKASADLTKTVHALSARYNSPKQAEKAGYVEDTFCVASPAGGMGYHWVNQSLVDPVYDPLVPEVVLYAPDKNGKPKLAAVEYIVIDVGQPRPTFNGYPFDIGGTPVPVPHYSLHVWVHRSNPSGLNAPWNPDVVCPDPN